MLFTYFKFIYFLRGKLINKLKLEFSFLIHSVLFNIKRFNASFNIQSNYFLKSCKKKLSVFFNESLRGVKVIRAFGEHKTLESKFMELMDDLIVKIHVKIAVNRYF